MECVDCAVVPEVPDELSTATSATTAFYKVTTPLEQLEGEEAVRKHTLFATSRGHLVEATGGSVQRSILIPKDVTKVVVHHDFEPLQLYVVLLCASGRAILLAYADFKVLHEWSELKDIASTDSNCAGSPQLLLKKSDGGTVKVSNTQLMSFTQRTEEGEKENINEEKDDDDDEEKEEEEKDREKEEKEDEKYGEARGKGKRDAIQALMHRFKGGIKHAEQLRNQRKKEENFIAEELESLRSRLMGQPEEKEENLVTALAIGKRDAVVSGVGAGAGSGDGGGGSVGLVSSSPGPLQVLRVFQNLIHDKWVIMVTVINEGLHEVVAGMELVLCCEEEGPLQHTCLVLKSVRHSSMRQPGDFRVTIEHLHPLLLKPKKRATVIGVCDIPTFRTGPKVSCSGLLTYTTKPLKHKAKGGGEEGREGGGGGVCTGREYQVSIPSVTLEAQELHLHKSSWEHCLITRTESVSFSTVALVAASAHRSASLTTLVSPLDGFLDRVARHIKFIKVSGVSDFYLVYPKESSHPLHLSGFILHPINAHHLILDLCTRDERQAMILAHSLLAALPKDTTLAFHSPTTPQHSHSNDASTTSNHPTNTVTTTNTYSHHSPKKRAPLHLSSLSSSPNLQQLLLGKMREGVDVVISGLEGQLKNEGMKGKVMKIGEGKGRRGGGGAGGEGKAGNGYMKDEEEEKEDDMLWYIREREEVLGRRREIVFTWEEFAKWRRKLQDVEEEIDGLYLNFLKVNCG